MEGLLRLAETPRVWRELDQWIRHRMRAIQLKQWRRGTTAYRELRARGARQDVALMVAGNMRRWWRNSGMPLNGVLDLSWADNWAYPVSVDLNFSNRRMRTRLSGGVAGERGDRSPYADFEGPATESLRLCRRILTELAGG
jgi:hypothetical protein